MGSGGEQGGTERRAICKHFFCVNDLIEEIPKL